MKDQEQLHLALAEYYAKQKGWEIFIDQNSYFTAIKYKVPPGYQGETTYVPAHKLTDLNWLAEIEDMLIEAGIINFGRYEIDSVNNWHYALENTNTCKSCSAIAPRRYLAWAQALCIGIKHLEKK